MDASEIWYSLLYALIAIYAILDGFDLGAGMIHLLAGRAYRPLIIRAIAPFWDGNEVWLVTVGQLLLATFPAAYGAILSALYYPILAVTTSLVLRACAMEFRGKLDHPLWTLTWDLCLFGASALAAASYGLIMGILTIGLPLTPRRYLDLAQVQAHGPFVYTCSALVVFAFALQGCGYLAMRIRGEFQGTLRVWGACCLALLGSAILYLFALAPRYAPHLYHPPISLANAPMLALGILIYFTAAVCLARALFTAAFAASSALIAWGVAQFALGNFPYLIRAHNDLTLSITAYNALASSNARFILSCATLAGLPLVACYTAWVYWIFRGPIEDDRISY